MQVARAIQVDTALEFGPGVRVGIGGAVHDEGQGRVALAQWRPPGAVKQDALAAIAQGLRLVRKLQPLGFEQRIGQRFEQAPGFGKRRGVRDARRSPGAGLGNVRIAARRVGIDGVHIRCVEVFGWRIFDVQARCVRVCAVRVLGMWILREKRLFNQRILARRQIERRHRPRQGEGLHAARIDPAGQGQALVSAPVQAPQVDGVAVVLGIAQFRQRVPEFGAQGGLVVLNEDQYLGEIPAFLFKRRQFERRQFELGEGLGRFIRARPFRQ